MAEQEETEAQEAAKSGVTTEQVLAAYTIPAPWANKTVITAPAGGNHVRLSFMETHADKGRDIDLAVPRAAVTMHITDMISLRNLLTKFIDNSLTSITVRIGPDGAEIVPEEEADG